MTARCTVDGCGKELRARGMCSTHYSRWRLLGDPLACGVGKGNHRRIPFAERFDGRWTKTHAGCWEWNGDRRNGYGSTWLNGRRTYAHRAVYAEFVGPLADDEVVRHLCDNPACVNPEHLEKGTPKDNSRDMSSRGRWRNQHGAGHGWQPPTRQRYAS